MKAEDGNCAVIAVSMISAVPIPFVQKAAEKYPSYDGHDMSIRDCIQLATEIVGHSFRRMIDPRGCNVNEAAREVHLGLVFAEGKHGKSHVMPVVDGVAYNKCGWGKEPAGLLVEF